MNKQDLVRAIASDAHITQDAAAHALDATLRVISASLAAGDEVKVVGFGTFKTTPVAARVGRNPKTGAALTIPASVRVKFTVGKGLKDAVNG